MMEFCGVDADEFTSWLDIWNERVLDMSRRDGHSNVEGCFCYWLVRLLIVTRDIYG